MPSVKMPKKSLVNDMTPFVDVAFLILFFFIMATKFKPPEPVEITTPNSVSTDKLPDNDAVMVEIAQDGRIFFSIRQESAVEGSNVKYAVISNLNKTRNLGLTEAEMQNFTRVSSVGVPFSQLKQLLARPAETHKDIKQPGIPVKDSATNELVYWIRDSKAAFAGRRLSYLIKGDNSSKYPDFKRVMEAMTRNDEFKFKLVTSPEDAPSGTELYQKRMKGGDAADTE
jgi:biopolymer transport protein ExbD